MQNVKINPRIFFSIILFLLNPVIGLIYSLYNITKTYNRNIIFIIIALFFSVLTIKNPPIHDIYRYLLRFDSINQWQDIGLFTNDYFFDYLTLTFKFFDIPFFLIPPVFVLLTIFLDLKSIDIILKHYKYNKKKSLFIIIFTIAIINPINISLGLRSHLSFAFFLFGLVNLLTTSNKKNYLYFFLAFLTHTASFILILSYFISKFFKPNKFLTLVLSIICLLASAIILNTVFSLPFFAEKFSTLSVYTEFDNLSDKSTRGMLYYYISTTIKIIFIGLFFIFFDNKMAKEIEYKLFYFINILVITTCACNFSEIAFGRYTAYVVILTNLVLIFQNKNKKYLSLLLISYFIYSVFITSIYINRNNIINGDYFIQSIKPPIFLLMYTDEEYRNLLSNTDITGYPISGPGS